jgi:hypothetical protein
MTFAGGLSIEAGTSVDVKARHDGRRRREPDR